MMSIGSLLGPAGFAGVLVLAAILWLAYRNGWHRRFVTDRELANAAKLLFIALAAMMMIAINNSLNLPEAQFIYGRF